MKYLPLPAPHSQDLAIIDSICIERGWQMRQLNWFACYNNYQKFGGDPWAVTANTFSELEKAELYHLYDQYSQSTELVAVRDAVHASCPVCGSQITGQLDHYLPRKHYPEFSIQRANLVPACTHCNSGGKRTTVKGNVSPERFIHPYFDAWASQPLWKIVFKPPFAAAKFRPHPLPGLPPAQATIVAFHLKNVLGKQFLRFAITRWSGLPAAMAIQLETSTPTIAELTKQLMKELGKSENTTASKNSWESAFFRGLLADPVAISHVLGRMAYV